MFSERREQAIRWMLRSHEGQVRKAEPEIPYVSHLIHVALMVQESGGDEDCVIAGLLHDILEDTDVTVEELETAFGPRVAGIVQEVSEDKSLRWADRKARMIARLGTASPEACLIAAVDKTYNLETLVLAHGMHGPSVWDHFRGAPGPTVRFYADALGGSARADPCGAGRKLLAGPFRRRRHHPPWVLNGAQAPIPRRRSSR